MFMPKFQPNTAVRHRQGALADMVARATSLTERKSEVAKFRVSFDLHFCVDRRTSLVEKIPFLQYHQVTTGTLPRHHGKTQNMSKTPKTSPDTVKILHYRHTTKVSPIHQRPPKQKLTDHQDTSTKDTTNSQKDLQRVFPKKLLPTYFVMINFPHHHLLASPSTQHRHNNIITAPSSSSSSSSSPSFSS